MFTYYLIYYFIFAFIGWLLDSTYSSFVRKRLVFSGAIKGLPFCYIYGLGGLLLLWTFNLDISLYKKIVLGTLVVTTLEYVGGLFCKHVLKERMWDYSKIKGNIQGHISWIHTSYWFIASIIFGTFLYAAFVEFDKHFREMLEVANVTNQILLVITVIVVPIVMYYRFRKNYIKEK